MTISTSLPTWEVLKEFGFRPNAAGKSITQPELCFDFGNFILTANALKNLQFQDVVIFSGILTTPRTVTMVEFEMPQQIDSQEKCAAWLMWHLDKSGKGKFQPLVSVSWLEMGRENIHLLPWYFDSKKHQERPHCIVNKELARPLLKTLAKIAEQVPIDEIVWFTFDGEVLKIRVANELLAIGARGKAWANQFGLKAAQLTKPPRRILGESVWFAIWEDSFSIANFKYPGVISKPTDKS